VADVPLGYAMPIIIQILHISVSSFWISNTNDAHNDDNYEQVMTRSDTNYPLSPSLCLCLLSRSIHLQVRTTISSRRKLRN
jgi:hypothetical protein